MPSSFLSPSQNDQSEIPANRLPKGLQLSKRWFIAVNKIRKLVYIDDRYRNYACIVDGSPLPMHIIREYICMLRRDSKSSNTVNVGPIIAPKLIDMKREDVKDRFISQCYTGDLIIFPVIEDDDYMLQVRPRYGLIIADHITTSLQTKYTQHRSDITDTDLEFAKDILSTLTNDEWTMHKEEEMQHQRIEAVQQGDFHDSAVAMLVELRLWVSGLENAPLNLDFSAPEQSWLLARFRDRMLVELLMKKINVRDRDIPMEFRE